MDLASSSTAVSWQSEFYRLIHADSRVATVADSLRNNDERTEYLTTILDKLLFSDAS